jgi:DNA-binding LacI/PurR family transcriptional regulator
LAIGVLKAAHGLDLTMPQQLLIVGFKDISWFSFSVARLNTIVQPK